ncbi:alkaline phosphatase PhoX [Ferrimonas pelagia]|uniref:Lipoprotein n=1 Tax=Ferrimonas pelagia TaxID=1177826 RepID=A0ABP9ENF9_9GAMM
MNKNKISLLAVAVALGLTGCWQKEIDRAPPSSKPEKPEYELPARQGELMRLATAPIAGQVTGMVVRDDSLLMNVKHPNSNATGEVPITAGVITQFANLDLRQIDVDFDNSSWPTTAGERQTLWSTFAGLEIIAEVAEDGLGDIQYVVDKDGEAELSDELESNVLLVADDGTQILYTAWDDNPGAISRLLLDKNDQVLDTELVDLSGVAGTAGVRKGNLTPWGTPLFAEHGATETGSEAPTLTDWNKPLEQEDAALPIRSESDIADRLDAYLGEGEFPNPYRYGYMMELTNPEGEVSVEKRFAMGRFEHDSAMIMPNGTTVYLGQGGIGGVLYKFEADSANELRSGTLYAAKVHQDIPYNHPSLVSFDVEWIELGRATDAEVEGWIADFDGIDMDDYVEGQSSYLTNADVLAWSVGASHYPSVAEGGNPTTAGLAMDDRVVFLETRQAAKFLGASAEWSNMSGLTFNTERAAQAQYGSSALDEDVTQAYAYFAIPTLSHQMVWAFGDIQLTTDTGYCGMVYRMPIDDNFEINRIEPALFGDKKYPDHNEANGRCHRDSPAQPSELVVMDDGRVLVAEEFTALNQGGHQNAAVWLYDPYKE